MIGKTGLLRRALGLLAALAAVVGREELKESRSVTMRTDVGWGLVDATAIPGKLFEYSLPRTTLEGQPTKYTVFEAGSDRLPKWLSFDSRRNILEGVPSFGDRDRPYFMEVSAENIFGGKNETISKDVFVIDVRNEVAGSSARPLGDLHGNATIVCAPGDAVTMATVTMDADFDAMSGSTRAKLIRDFGRHVGLSVTSLRMRSSGGHDDDDDHHRLDNIPLVAGPGNVASPKNSNSRTLLLQWVVGCGSVVTSENVPILEHLEATAVNGSLAEDTGSGIIGWHVTTTSSRTPRRKRLVPPPLPLHHPTATPLQTRRPPFGQPTATRVVFPTDGGPETRVFPTPVAPGASVTSDRPLRSKSRQRHPGKTKHGKQTRMPYSRGDESDPDYFKNNRRPTPGDVSPVLSTTRVVQVTGYPGVPDTPKHPDYLEPSLPFPVASVATVPTRPLASSTKLPTTRKMKISDGGRPWDIPGQGEALPTADDDDNNSLPPLWKFTVSVGEVFAYAFPTDTFHRHEDLELVLITPDDPSRSWIKVDADARKLYGLPLERDAGGGVVRCALVGRDSRGEVKKLYDVEVAIRRRLNSGPGNHEVRVDLDAVYDRFAGDVDRRIDVATRIAHAHGDRDAAHVRVARILEGSVEFFWSNRSLADEDPCPVDGLRRIADRMIRTDGLLVADFTRAMGPHEVRSVTFTPKGTSCMSQMTARIGNRKERVEEQEVEEEPGSDPGLATSVDGLLITTIVPILILVVVIIFILIVVCVVCSRRRKKNRNKNNTEEEEEEKVKVAGGGSWGAASRKGVPVIFADELEEKSTGPSRALTVTSSSSADERRPMIAAIPPDYDHPTGGHSPSSPPLVPGRDQDVTARRRNSPPAYNNGANHPTTTATTAASTPHHRRVASGGSSAQQASRDPPSYVSS